MLPGEKPRKVPQLACFDKRKSYLMGFAALITSVISPFAGCAV